MTKPRGERFIAVADNHGEEIDQLVAEAVLNFINDYRPTIRIHLGDAFDLKNLRKGASDEEKMASL